MKCEGEVLSERAAGRKKNRSADVVEHARRLSFIHCAI
jgi:hypothetical protein